MKRATFKTTILSVAALALALTACGPASLTQNHETDGPGHTRGGTPEIGESTYEFVTYDVLYTTLHDALAVIEMPYPGTGPDDPASPNNPREDPIGFIQERAATMGAPQYDPNSPDGTIQGKFTSLGIKNWILAANGACAIAMNDPATADALFPSGATEYEEIFVVLLGRFPEAAEVALLDELTAQFSSELDRETAVCTTLLGTQEFLTIN